MNNLNEKQDELFCNIVADCHGELPEVGNIGARVKYDKDMKISIEDDGLSVSKPKQEGFEEWWKMIVERSMGGEDDPQLKSEYLECWNAALSRGGERVGLPRAHENDVSLLVNGGIDFDELIEAVRDKLQ
jgi:hypothetical protein